MKKLFCILIAIICCIPCVQLTFVSAGFEESVEQPILLENLEFCIKGFEVGADPNNVEVSVNDERIEIVDIVIIGTLPYLGKEPIRNGLPYRLDVIFKLPEGYTAEGMETEDITLNGLPQLLSPIGPPRLSSSSVSGFENSTYCIFEIPALGEPLMDLGKVELCMEGYKYGNIEEDIIISSEKEEVTIKSRYLSTEKSTIYDNEYELMLGTKYSVRVSMEVPIGYDICNVDPANFTLGDIPASSVLRSTKDYESFSIVFELPALYAKGNVDGDGFITVSDALSLLRVTAKLSEATEQLITDGDLDGDGEITVSDALAVLRLAAKLNQE